MAIVGYYLTCDDAYCEEHADLEGWEGFEGWEAPIAIDDQEAVDSPIHCEECGVLLETDLTSDGYKYVLDAILEDFMDGKRNPVTHAWAKYFSQYADWGFSDVLDFYFAIKLDPAWFQMERLRKYVRLIGELDGD